VPASPMSGRSAASICRSTALQRAYAIPAKPFHVIASGSPVIASEAKQSGRDRLLRFARNDDAYLVAGT